MTIEFTKEEALEAYLAFQQRARSCGSGTYHHSICCKLASNLEAEVRLYMAEKELAKQSNGHHDD